MSKRSWQQLASKTVYENKWMKVREDKVLMPNGKESTYGVVEKEPFAAVIPVVEGKFCLVRQARYPVSAESWEFPMGHIDPGESIEACARRELAEETGLTAKALVTLGEVWVAPGHHTQSYRAFTTDTVKHGKASLEESESDLEVGWFTLAELKDMIEKNIIKDGPTIAAFCLYLLHTEAKQ